MSHRVLSGKRPVVDPILWEGNVRALDLPARVEVARSLGCRKMSLSPQTLRTWQAQGLSLAEIEDVCGEVRLAHLDPLVRWNRGHHPDDLSPQLREFSTTSQDDFFACAELLGVESITLPAIVAAERATPEELADDFARVCDRARPLGIRCDLEFLPYWSGVRTLRAAAEIVERAGRDNGKVLFDVYHFVRGGGTPDEILEVDGQLIAAIQISDGAALPPVGADLVHDMLNSRMLPGRGEFQLERIVAALTAIGAGRVVGVEVFSTELDRLDRDDLVAALVAAGEGFVADFLSGEPR
jgi:4-hydroxyphenylpyruvate dioxygenase